MNALNVWLETFFRRGRHRGVYTPWIGSPLVWTSIRDAPQDRVRRDLSFSVKIQPDVAGFDMDALQAAIDRWQQCAPQRVRVGE